MQILSSLQTYRRATLIIGLLVTIGGLACSQPAPSPTNTPTPAPSPTAESVWTSYVHNRDRGESGCAFNRPNFSVDVPPSWAKLYGDCVSVDFEAPNQHAGANVVIERLEEYSLDPAAALSQLAADLGHDFVMTDTMGYDRPVRVTKTEKVEHHGETALRQRLWVESDYGTGSCTEVVDRMIVLPTSWGAAQRAVVVTVFRCKDETREHPNLERLLASFRLTDS